ncbi:MAG: phenylpropionate dioxygenase-like ring-hydroxylating dioxygenase large terminal subunit [Enterobacterales bacterium]|jgi:phenylpropionate dioxygenase-like ring-hydroxylating dioxygenase large terminal subunit
MDNKAILNSIEAHTEKTSLTQNFYMDKDIYERDISEIYLKSWLYAGHSSEIPAVGDWFLFEMAGESVVIIRSAEDEINAFLNVCRHRGSKICLEQKGNNKILVCPYHSWGYGLDGHLRGAPYMKEDFDKTKISLKKIKTEILEGLIYVNFADEPASFAPIKNAMTECLRPYRLDKAKVVHKEIYPIIGNWKLAVENYTECYHCSPAHPEYSRGHSLAKPDVASTELMEKVMSRAEECGLSDKELTRYYLDAEGFGADYAYTRYPLWRGHITGSDDGKPVAPLMGDIKDYDGGTTDFQVGPVCFALAYCDHVVIYNFTPTGIDTSECVISWLVNGDAVEGKDYNLERLRWLWDVTTIADKRIIENNAKGVSSRYYIPGPLSAMEDFTWSFISWYLQAIKPSEEELAP